MSNYHQGIYKIQNPQKYRGNPNNIIFRSSWELKILRYFDTHPSVIWFASEELAIPYISPKDNKKHRYFPDFIANIKQKDGKDKIFMIEVKPFHQTQLPKQTKKTKRFLQETITYAINQEKWRAAELFCLEHGWQFMILTEKNINFTL